MSQQCDGKHWWLPCTAWEGQAEAGRVVRQGLWGSSLSLPDHPSVLQHLVGLSLGLVLSPCSAWPPSQHGGADGTGDMLCLQLH